MNRRSEFFYLNKPEPLVVFDGSDWLVSDELHGVAVVRLVDHLQAQLGRPDSEGGALVEGLATDFHHQRFASNLPSLRNFFIKRKIYSS